ncbi:MAG: response regulator [Candidatus Cloacimonetes bacterium]|nr:response regulator [Candidatus Cloacimonadota bacterium]
MKILIVEDDSTSSFILGKLVMDYGAPHFAFNGKEAVDAVHVALAMKEPYDLIFLDIMMPVMNGQTALKKIRAAEEASGIASPDCAKIVMTTALSDTGNIKNAFLNQCDTYLVKPIVKAKLHEELQKLEISKSGEKGNKRMRILISEDDITTRNMLAAGLKKWDYEVVETKNGAEAWDVMQQPDAPQLAIIDWLMPVMDGLEFVRRVQARQAQQLKDGAQQGTVYKPYIIMLTIKGEKKDIIAGLGAGADDYLTKPFDPGELWARVEVGRRMVVMQERLASQVQKLYKAFDHIKTLQGILPICSFCKKIRNDDGYWSQVEEYVSSHSEAAFSHSVCPDCMDKHYPDIEIDP